MHGSNTYCCAVVVVVAVDSFESAVLVSTRATCGTDLLKYKKK